MTQNGSRTGILLSGYYGCGNLGDDLLLTVAVEELRTILPGARYSAARSRRRPAEPRGGRHIHRRRRDPRRSNAIAAFPALRIHRAHGGPAAAMPLADLRRRHGVSRQRRARLAGAAMADLPSRPRVGRADRGAGRRRRRFAQRDGTMAACAASSRAASCFWCATTRRCDSAPAPRHALPAIWSSRGDLCRRTTAASDRPAQLATIGLTVSPQAGERTIAALADAVRIGSSKATAWSFWSFSKAPPSRTTPRCSPRSAPNSAPRRSRSKPAAPAADAAAINNAFADIDIVCGMRFHSLVLAAMLERPFVGIVHDNKISEICRRFDMPCHDAAALDGADLVRSAESIRARCRTRNCSNKAARWRRKISVPLRRWRPDNVALPRHLELAQFNWTSEIGAAGCRPMMRRSRSRIAK